MILEGNWVLRVRDKVYRDLARLPLHDRARLLDVIEDELPTDPYRGDTEKMHNDTYSWRRRIGAYRVIYEMRQDEHLVYVYKVKRRTSSTY